MRANHVILVGAVRNCPPARAHLRAPSIMLPMALKDVLMAVFILATIFGLTMIGLSIRANARFRDEERLPMQWKISRSEPLSRTVIWSAPRVIALGLTPSLAICTLVLFTVGTMTLTPRPGQEGMVIPSLILVGSGFVAAHVFHLWLIGKTLHRSGN